MSLNQPWEDKKVEKTDWDPLKNMAEMQGRYLYDFPRPSVTADMIVLSKSSFGTPYVLLIKRGNEPYKGCWALPGGFLDMNETLQHCAVRELSEETGIELSKDVNIFGVGTFDRVNRDPRGRVIASAFKVYIDKNEYKIKAGDDAKEVKWFNMNKLPELAFDHKDIIEKASGNLLGLY